MLHLFNNITLTYLLYLVYGAAFFFLGVSVASKDMKGSDLKLAGSLWLLGTFGFLHGAREWLELGRLIEVENLSHQQLVVEKAAEVLFTLLSFIFLLQFATSLILKLDIKRTGWLKAIPVPLFVVWFFYIWQYGLRSEEIPRTTIFVLQQAEIGARYTFGFTGAMLTAYGLISYSREVRNLSPSMAKMLLYAGSTFISYALFSGIITTSYFIPTVPIPIELFRILSAFFITFFITNALNIFDIEARKKIEQQTHRLVQIEKLTSLGQLAAGIAHEINNPLTNASLGIQTLKKWSVARPDNQDFVKKLDGVERNIDRASAIALELLQFSRQQECEIAPLNINSVLESALTLLQYKLKPVTVVRSLQSVPEVLGDRGKLEQVFINILSNSIEAIVGGGTITIASAAHGDMVLVTITDTGFGIEAKNHTRLFDPFFTTKEIGSGTGLGLSICYGIIRQHHGTIVIDSESGKGTEVTIKLPALEHYEKYIDR